MRVVLGVALAALALPAGLVKGEPYIFDTVALSGDPVPGTTETFAVFDVPVLNRAGDVAFVGVFGAAFDRGIFAHAGGTLRKIALGGEPAPGTSATFADFGAPALNAAGDAAFVGVFGAANDQGIFRESDGTLSAVALTGNFMPGKMSTFADLSPLPVLNEAGDIAFEGFFSADEGGVFKESAGTLTTLALTSDLAPGTSGTFAGLFDPVVNGAGEVAFRGALGSAFGAAIFKKSGGTLAALAITGDSAPGTSATFADFGGPALNGAGDTAFLASTRFGAAHEGGIFKQSAGTLTAVALTGDLVPGTSGIFAGLFAPVLNGVGEVAFRGAFGPGTNDVGIFTDSVGTLTTVALTGDPAPGTNGTFRLLDPPTLNEVGEVAFTGFLRFVSLGGSGAFVFDPVSAVVHKILADGDMLEVASGDKREVQTVLLFGGAGSGNQDGRRSGFNDRGQAALRVVFTDGSEAIVRATPGTQHSKT